MAITAEYRAWLEELFSSMGAVSVRRFFNLDGLYSEGAMFGLVAEERVYFKTDMQSRKPFEQEGAQKFVYRARNGREIVTSYYALPDRLYDDRKELARWAGAALEVARKSPTALRKRRR